MKNDTDIEKQLERLGEAVSLRAHEKAEGRAALEAFMRRNPRPVRSPYARLVRHGFQTAAAFAAFIVIGGTTGAVAAEGARPGDFLYPVKLSVTEPARSALILDREEKSEFELERAERRLSEFAAYSASEDPAPDVTALIAASLSKSITALQEDVRDLAGEGSADDALAMNAELQAVLTAHGEVLDEIEARNPAAGEDIATVEASLDSGIAGTENAEQELENALDTSLTEEGTDAHADETEEAFLALRARVQGGLESLEEEDSAAAASDLSEIESIVAEARDARAAGDLESAFLLYTEADSRLTELDTRIDADALLDTGLGDPDGE